MPGMDGNETLRELKIIKPALPVIMLTAHGTIHSALESWRDEVYAYLTKPYDMDLLADKIREAFANKKGIDGALWYSVWKEEQPPD